MTTNKNRGPHRRLSDNANAGEQLQNGAPSSFLDREIPRRGFVAVVGAVTGADPLT